MRKTSKKYDEELKHTVHQMVPSITEKRGARRRNRECWGWHWAWGAGMGRGGGIPGSQPLAGQEAYQSQFVAILSVLWYVHQACGSFIKGSCMSEF